MSSKFNVAIGQLAGWFENVDMERLLGITILVGLTFLLRRHLAAFFTAVIVKLLSAIRINMSDDARAEIQDAVEIILVVLAILAAFHALSPPAVGGGVFLRILYTFIVVALYVPLFRRADLVIATVIPGLDTKMGADKNWVVRLFRMAVAIMAFATVADVWGIDLSGALTGVGVLGAGVAIAAQDFVGNFVAGLNNISERRFFPGDWIKVENEVEGTVVSMDLRSTTVMGFDRVPRCVPNSKLSNGILLNYNRMDHRQIDWTFGIVLSATNAQIEAICTDLTRYIEDSGEFVTDGSLLCFAVPAGLTESAIEIKIYIFAKTVSYQTYLEVCGRLTLALRKSVSDAGTKLAHPTRTIFLENTGEEGVPAASTTERASSSLQQGDDRKGNDG